MDSNNALKYMRVIMVFFIAMIAQACIRAMPGEAVGGQGIKVLVYSIKDNEAAILKGARQAADAVEIRKGPSGWIIANGKNARLPVRLRPRQDFIYINSRPYRGEMHILDSKEGVLFVNEISVEWYVMGIIGSEISTKWPFEAVKAQAIIARTYALYNRAKRGKEPYHLQATVLGQVYGGAAKEDEAAKRAVKETMGAILTYNGEPALAVYHSNAGGRTESSEDVWKKDYPYLTPVESAYDTDAPNFQWELSVNAGTLKGLLNSAGHDLDGPDAIMVDSKTRSGRIKTLVIRDAHSKEIGISGEDLRKILGYDKLKSTLFEAEKTGDEFVFKGRGAGHGVGLSQWGAKGMADKGYSYKEILKHYYPGTRLNTL